MSTQAIQLMEIFKQLPLAERLYLLELFFKNIKEETMGKNKDEEEMCVSYSPKNPYQNRPNQQTVLRHRPR